MVGVMESWSHLFHFASFQAQKGWQKLTTSTITITQLSPGLLLLCYKIRIHLAMGPVFTLQKYADLLPTPGYQRPYSTILTKTIKGQVNASCRSIHIFYFSHSFVHFVIYINISLQYHPALASRHLQNNSPRSLSMSVQGTRYRALRALRPPSWLYSSNA